MARMFFVALLCLMVITADAKDWTMREDKEEDKEEKAPFDKIIEENKNVPNEDLYEGDIKMNKQLERYILRKKTNPDSEDSPFDAISNGQWPDAKVPYVFASGFPAGHKQAVAQAIAEYNKKTCIKFVRRSAERNYIYFFVGGGCYSMIGRQGGSQKVSLGRGCGTKGVAIHEMMHALGFFHEQSRRDRDKYIRINFGNIPRGVWYNFEKYRSGQASTLGEPYDKSSVMHYGNYAFSTNGRKTIESISNPNERLGQRNGLSLIDARQLNKYYKCAGTGTKTTRAPITPPPPSGCTDGYIFCSVLAKAKFCSASWVKMNCKKSCKDASCSTCKDKNNLCTGWAKSNPHCTYSKGCCTESSLYSSYMQRNCKRACGMC